MAILQTLPKLRQRKAFSCSRECPAVGTLASRSQVSLGNALVEAISWPIPIRQATEVGAK